MRVIAHARSPEVSIPPDSRLAPPRTEGVAARLADILRRHGLCSTASHTRCRLGSGVFDWNVKEAALDVFRRSCAAAHSIASRPRRVSSEMTST